MKVVAFNRMPTVSGHPCCECYLSEQWTACDATFDEAYYKTKLRRGVFTEEQMPTIDWDGETNLIPFKPWIKGL